MAVNGSNYFEVTIASSQVPSDLTDFPVYVDLADLGGTHGFWGKVAADGSDIRVTKSDGTTEVPFELVSIDTANNTGELHFKASGTLSSTSDTIFRVYYNSSDTAYAVTDTYGRNNVWTDYYAVWHLNEDPSGTAPQFIDATGNGKNLTSLGSMTSADQVVGQLGNAIDFDGSDDRLIDDDFDFNSSDSTGPITAQFWNNVATGDGGGSAFGSGGETNSERLHVHAPYSDDNLYWYYGTPGNTELSASYASYYDKWTMIHLIGDEGFQEIFFDGVSQNSASNGATRPTFADFAIGQYATSHHNGLIDEVRIRLEILSDGWITAEYTNQNSTTTFYTLSTEQSVSGGGVEMGFSIGASSGVSPDIIATAESSVSVSQSQGVDSGTDGIGNSLLSIAKSLGASISGSGITDMSLSIPTIHSVTITTDTQVIVDMGFSTGLQHAIDIDGVSNINVSYSLDSSLQTAFDSQASADGNITINTISALQLLGSAIAEAGLSMNVIESITIEGQTITANVTLSDGRTFTIKLENRSVSIQKENRSLTIPVEDRTHEIS